jgi:hypothetical protein
MYSKKYILENVEEFGRHNPIYDNAKGHICYPAYLKVGERGWLLYEVRLEDEWMAYPHRLYTSIIKNVDYVIGDDFRIVIDTEHTRLTLKAVKE